MSVAQVTVEADGVEAEEAYPKHNGGGWYVLSNGDKVQGKDEAERVERTL